MKGCLRSIIIFLILVSVIGQIMKFLEGGSERYRVSSYDPDCEEVSLSNNSGDKLHRRFWGFKEQNNTYCVTYQSLDSIERLEREKRLDMLINYREENFWGSIYASLVNQTGTKLDYLADSLYSVARENDYSKLDLVRLIVSFVQDIPYSYVIPSNCDEYQTDGKPCIGNIPYGITSPYEFVHSLHGDCDTRAVLLYVLLEKLQFFPMIVVSDEYAHAMLAIDLPAQGDFIRYAGRKYYFWETTATGWSIGMLPPDTNNVDYWEIALVNES